MTKQHPIPDDALDDRIAGVGTSGSGKTYNLGTASSHFQNTVSGLRTLAVVTYPDRGTVAIEPWVWA